ncbi:MAG: hypothetical protein PHQ09_02750 [Actinomycetota bacterium]|nr:hypothetical protein [Actinomycetota bacterium]
MMKKISIINKEEKGNISILVLIIGLAVILLTTAMVGYIFRDVGFTEQDKDKLRALNFAESGISNMYLNIDRYYNEGIPIPSSPITGEIEDNGEIQGSFEINYEYHDNGGLSYYIITSKGIDKSGSERTVRVRINVIEAGPELDIYDYVYTSQTVTFGGNYEPVDGPFYTEGDLNVTAGSFISQQYNPGPVVVKGNLNMSGDATIINPDTLSVGGNVVMEGSAKIKGSQVNIAGNLTMSGGTYIDDSLISPMIVMGNINMSGSARIGESGRELILSCPGTVTSYPWTPIYATRDDSLTYTFVDPVYNVADLINEYYSDVQGSALNIDGNLKLEGTETGPFIPYSRSSGGNSLSFTKDASGKYILEVHGNVIINGNLQIGGNSWWPKSVNTTYYKGKGIIYTTGDIKTFTKLIPLNVNDFPEDTLLVLISNGKIEFDIFDYWVQPPSCSSPNIYVVAIAKGNIKMLVGVVRGTLIAGGILDINNAFSKVCFEDDISEYLPSELPGSSSGGGGGVTITKGEWQEVID